MHQLNHVTSLIVADVEQETDKSCKYLNYNANRCIGLVRELQLDLGPYVERHDVKWELFIFGELNYRTRPEHDDMTRHSQSIY